MLFHQTCFLFLPRYSQVFEIFPNGLCGPAAASRRSLLVRVLCQFFCKPLFMLPVQPLSLEPPLSYRATQQVISLWGCQSQCLSHQQPHQRHQKAAQGVFIHLPGPSTVVVLHQETGTPLGLGNPFNQWQRLQQSRPAGACSTPTSLVSMQGPVSPLPSLQAPHCERPKTTNRQCAL